MPAIPSTGAISLTDFATEFGGTAPHSLSEYYRDGANVPGNNTNVPTAGAFGFSQMRGAINAIINTLANTTNVDLSTVFGSNWASSVPKEIIIPSGVTIGGTGSSDALIAPSGMGGTLTITNAGNIIGFGGAASSAGGNAINIASANITVANSGLIAGGGGGGGNAGQGGQGGQGSVYMGYTRQTTQTYASCSGANGGCATPRTGICNGSQVGIYSSCRTGSCCMGDAQTRVCTYQCHNNVTGGAGGAGGSGGVGQGYNQTNANGSGGSAGANGSGSAGNGGTGGTGGNGATYGNSGGSGATGSTGANGSITNGSAGSGGASGGAAGAAVIYSVAYTMNNSGTLSGAA